MLQQTALLLVAGLVFLFFFTPDNTGVSNPAFVLILSAVLTFAPGLLAYILGRRAIRRLADGEQRRISQLRNSRLFALLFGILALLGYIFELYYLKLPNLITEVFSFWKFRNSRALIGIMPLIVAILLTRLATFELDRQVRNTSWTRRQFLSLNLKLMLLPLSPFIIFILISDIIDHSPLNVRIFFITNPYIYWMIMLSVIAVIYIQSPSFMRRIWATRPLPDGELRRRIEAMADRENIKYKDVLVWDTAGGKIANAGMAGLLHISRYIFLTNALLAHFTIDEIETVVAHEFGHIKYRHMMSYLVLSIGYMVLYSFLYTRLLPLIERLSLGLNALALLSAVATMIAFYIYFIFIFRFLSRRFERQSDLYAVDVTGKPATFKSALMKLSSINYTPRRVSWLSEIVRTHPSVARRLQFIDRAVWGHADAERYRQPVLRMGWMFALIVVGLVLMFGADRKSLFPPGEIHYEIGRQYAIEGMLDKAILEFKAAEQVSPRSEHIHQALGVLYAEKGDVKKAAQELEKALKINPKNAIAQKKLQQIKDNQED